MDAGRAAELASRAAAARVAVVTLPATNLYLQGRDSVHPQVRGLTALNRLEEAGVLVAEPLTAEEVVTAMDNDHDWSAGTIRHSAPGGFAVGPLSSV